MSSRGDINQSGISESQSEFDKSLALSNNPSEKDRSGYQSTKILPHQGLPDIQSKEPISIYERPDLINQFPAFDKFKISLKGCMSKESKSKIATIFDKDIGKPLFNLGDDLDPGSTAHHEQMAAALKLTVKGTGILPMDEHVLHPFVRVHIIDTDTSKYLQKSTRNRPGVANRETCNFMQIVPVVLPEPGQEGKCDKKITSVDPNFLLPMSTKMNDLRIEGVNYCNWHEEFVINELAQNIYSPSVVIMFEILDFSTKLLVEGSNLLTPENFYPVAWAYLRPLGTANIHVGTRKLQLYQFRFNKKGDQAMKYNRPVDPRTPDVYLELDWPQRNKFNSFLEVDLSFCNRYGAGEDVPRVHISRAPWEREVGKEEGRLQATKKDKIRQKLRLDNEDKAEVLKKREQWEKFDKVDSILPNKLVQKFDSEEQGCFKIKFSHSGKYLAAACTLAKPASKSYSNNKTVIKIYDVEDGNLQIVLSGHRDLIHDLCWNFDDQYLVSASADGSVRVWNLQDIETDWSDKLNFHSNDEKFFITEILHPSFVYGAKIHPNARENPDELYMATICFDQKVRIICVSFDSEHPENQAFTKIAITNVMSINDSASFTLGNKKSAFDAPENLEDEMLRLIMNPQDEVQGANVGPLSSSNRGGSKSKNSVTEANLTKYKALVEQKHPCAITFDDSKNLLFVGDSQGQINVWRVRVANGVVQVVDHFMIKQKEIEGDQINEIIVHPECKNQLYVQSRDNCIRLIDYETGSGIKIRKRFFGAKCSKQMVQCTLSPDGKYLVSGSETGKPYIWDEFEAPVDSEELECNFADLVSDCDWNPRYNMFALSGFGQGFPILIYAYERSPKEFEDLMMAVQRQGGRLQTAILPDLNEPQNEELIDKIADQANVSQSEQSSPKKNARAKSEDRSRAGVRSSAASSDYGFSR